jgi:hypothetical protein
VAAQRVAVVAGGQQRSDLDPEGFQDGRCQARVLRVTAGVRARRSSRLVPALFHPAYWRSLLYGRVKGVNDWDGGSKCMGWGE